MRNRRNRLTALLLSLVLALLAATCAFAVADEPQPTRPDTPWGVADPSEPEAQEPVTQEPATQEPVTEEPTTQPPVTEPPTQHTHAFGAWKTVRRATAKQNGRQQRVCSCGEKQTRKILRVAQIKLTYESRVYNGKALTVPVRVKNAAGKALKKGRDYTVRFQNNKNVGMALVLLTGKGNYKFTAKRSFSILPRATAIKKILPGATNASVRWKAVAAQCGGYQLQIAADSGFQNPVVQRKVQGAKNASAAVNGLSPKTVYYARVRSVLTVKKVNYYSAWSKAVRFQTAAISGHAIDGQVPQSKRVSPTWFDDAVFVGDSVSLGLSYYEAAADVLGKAQFLTAGSLGSGNALQPVSEKSVHPRYNGQKMKVEKAVAACGANKVYIMLGMNDIGAYGVDKSVQNFRTLCKKILTESPFVTIYVESVTPRVNQGAKSDNVKLNNKNITAYNRKLAAVCLEEGWYFVNVAETMFDSTGHLKRAYCSDPDGMGMHFSYDGCKAWVDYLYTHTA